MRVNGTRKTGETFEVNIRTGDSMSRMNIEIPDDAVIYSPMMTLQLKQLKVGQTIRLKTFDPLSLGIREVVVEALRKETLQRRDGATETTVLSVESQGIDALTWIDEEGVVAFVRTIDFGIAGQPTGRNSRRRLPPKCPQEQRPILTR